MLKRAYGFFYRKTYPEPTPIHQTLLDALTNILLHSNQDEIIGDIRLYQNTLRSIFRYKQVTLEAYPISKRSISLIIFLLSLHIGKRFSITPFRIYLMKTIISDKIIWYKRRVLPFEWKLLINHTMPKDNRNEA